LFKKYIVLLHSGISVVYQQAKFRQQQLWNSKQVRSIGPNPSEYKTIPRLVQGNLTDVWVFLK
jgi:hypothetical protein